MGRRNWVIAAVAGLALVGVVPVAAAQNDQPPVPLEPIPHDEVTDQFDIEDGSYVGTIGLGGAFWLDTEGATVVWAGSATGPMQFSVSGGELSGTWGLSGTADIRGFGFPFEMAGINTWDAQGTVSGSNPYTLTGSGTTESSVSVAGVTQGSTDTYRVNTQLQDIVQVCDQVVGNWDQAIEAGFAGAPLERAMRSYFVVFAANPDDELRERAADLIERGTAIQQDLSGSPRRIISDLTAVLSDAEQLMSDLEGHPEGCPQDPSFMRVVTQIVGDVANTFLGQWLQEPTSSSQIQALASLLSLSLRAGAMGSGAGSEGAAAVLQANAEEILQRQFDDVVAGDPIDLDDLSVVAVSATLLGYTFESGVTGPDICVLVSEC